MNGLFSRVDHFLLFPRLLEGLVLLLLLDGHIASASLRLLFYHRDAIRVIRLF